MADASTFVKRVTDKSLALFKIILVVVTLSLMIDGAAKYFGDVSFVGNFLEGSELKIANAFTRSFLVFAFYVPFLAYVLRLEAIRTPLAGLLQPGLRDGWQIALIAAVFQTATLVIFFINVPERIFEASFFNAYVSTIAAIGGGLGEETIFRGFIIITLANAGFGRYTQIFLSGAFFGSVHMSWSMAALDAGLLAALSPVLGTFVLGCFLAWAFQMSGHKLLPVVVAHGLINIIIEPWLAVSYFG